MVSHSVITSYYFTVLIPDLTIDKRFSIKRIDATHATQTKYMELHSKTIG